MDYDDNTERKISLAMKKISSVLDDIDNDELLLLKGHLLIEESINSSLEYLLGKKNLEKLSISFYKKLILLDALWNNLLSNIGLFDQVKYINEMRNKLAHNLMYKSNIKKDLLNFLEKYFDDIPKTIHRRKIYIKTIKNKFIFMLGQLHGIHEAKIL